ncbi:MAG: hypothetical protein QOF09_1790 [Alphaproteobacteria bacterium]|jgi:hypothetical protein|nr:hypothetical protein [Alphaproteobacteria bacterium]
MTRKFHQDPTEFFSVVGAPYIHEHHLQDGRLRGRRTDDLRPRMLEIGVASVFAAFCAVALGVLLFAGSGTAKLVEVASYVVK